MLNAAQFAHAAQVLAAIVEGPTPADRQMDRHFRTNPRLGARDRGAIAEVVYACLRRFGLPRHLVGAAGPADAWLALHLLRAPREDAMRLADTIRALREKVGFCGTCGNFSEADPCPICTDSRRDATVVCVVPGVVPVPRVDIGPLLRRGPHRSDATARESNSAASPG